MYSTDQRLYLPTRYRQYDTRQITKANDRQIAACGSSTMSQASRSVVATRPWSDGNCSVGKTIPSVYCRSPVLSLVVATTRYAACLG